MTQKFHSLKRNENISPQKLVQSTVHNSPKLETTQMASSGEGINKTWYIYTMENYLVIKSNDFLNAKTWTNFKHTLCYLKKSRFQRSLSRRLHLYEISWKNTFIETEGFGQMCKWFTANRLKEILQSNGHDLKLNCHDDAQFSKLTKKSPNWKFDSRWVSCVNYIPQ